MWKPDRSRHQGRIVADLYRGGAGVPRQRQAVLAGGLRGANKDRELARAGIDRARYLTVGLDIVLQELARRSMIPVVAGLSPLEGAGLVHAEAQHVAKRLAALAAARRTPKLSVPPPAPRRRKRAATGPRSCPTCAAGAGPCSRPET